MHSAVAVYLSAWESFYIIVGSSAGALTGLQFVVMALVAETARPSTRHEIAAFGSPTVVHFCAVLLLGAIMSTPWRSLSPVAIAIGIFGMAGVVYVAIVIKRARLQSGYKPDLGDWMWHAGLPLASYSSLLIAAITLQRSPGPALFVVGAAALMLLFIGIHNSWDTVTYIAVGPWREAGQRQQEQRGARPEAPAESPQSPTRTLERP